MEQSTSDPPEGVGISFVADVMKRYRQLILVVRETSTFYTAACLLDDERRESIRAGLLRLCLELRPLACCSKAPGCSPCLPATAQVDNLVYITSDASKTRAHDRYLVVSTDGSWCNLRKFTGSQLRSTSYRIKLSECYLLAGQIEPTPNLSRRYSPNADEDINKEPAVSSVPQSPRYVVPPQIPEALAAPPSPPTDASQTSNSPLFLMEMFLCPVWIVLSVSIKTQLPSPTPHVLTNWKFLPLILQFRPRVLDHAGLVAWFISKTMSLS